MIDGQTTRRAILVALRQHGPMTGKALAERIEAHYPTVANLCSRMVADGDLEQNFDHGRRGRAYAAIGDVLLSDLDTIAGLIAAYGLRSVLRACAAASCALRDEEGAS